MNPWVLLDTADVPGHGGVLTLWQRDTEFSIRTDNDELMNSRMYSSEDALAGLTCDRLADRAAPHILIGGLGVGYTLAASLRQLGAQAKISMVELVPAVVRWNREHLGHLTGFPLHDERVTVIEEDVAVVLRNNQNTYDAILLDVDNGPEGLTRSGNDRLYDLDGLYASYVALRRGGTLAIWSAGPDKRFVKLLQRAGFTVEEKQVRARGDRGPRHTIWLADRGC